MSAAYYPVAPLPDTNSRQAAITVRPSSTALLAIDSEDRFTNYTAARSSQVGNPYSITISKNENIMPGFFTRLAVTEVVFPWVIPNINPKTNQIQVSVQSGGVGPVQVFVLSLNPTFATPAQIATAIQQALRLYTPNAGDTYPLSALTFVYGAIPVAGGPGINTPTNLCCFEYATNTATLVSFSPMPANSTAYPYPNTTKQLFDVLGFSTGQQTLATTGTGAFTLGQAIRYVDIVCNQLTNNQALKDTMSQIVVRDTLCRVYLANPGTLQSTIQPSDALFCPPGCAPMVVYRDFTHPKQIQWLPNQNIPGSLSFSVFDDTGAPLEESDPFFSPGVGYLNRTDWSLTLLVSEN
jgi:hypothetical protein